MKVYELMNALADLPGGADVFCSAALSVRELKAGIDFGEDDSGNNLYSISKPLDCVEDYNGRISLNF